MALDVSDCVVRSRPDVALAGWAPQVHLALFMAPVEGQPSSNIIHLNSIEQSCKSQRNSVKVWNICRWNIKYRACKYSIQSLIALERTKKTDALAPEEQINSCQI